MRLGEVEDRTDGHDASRIDRVVGHIVVTLDVVEVDRLGDAGLLVEIGQVTLEVRVVEDTAEAAFEMDVVDDVETDEGAEEPPVGLHDASPKR